MANIKSKIKRNKQSQVAALRNKQIKTLIKTDIKKFNDAVEAGDAAKATELGKEAIRDLDKAVSKGIIHLNRASQKKSAIAITLTSEDLKSGKPKPPAKAKAKPKAKAAAKPKAKAKAKPKAKTATKKAPKTKQR